MAYLGQPGGAFLSQYEVAVPSGRANWVYAAAVGARAWTGARMPVLCLLPVLRGEFFFLAVRPGLMVHIRIVACVFHRVRGGDTLLPQPKPLSKHGSVVRCK